MTVTSHAEQLALSNRKGPIFQENLSDWPFVLDTAGTMLTFLNQLLSQKPLLVRQIR